MRPIPFLSRVSPLHRIVLAIGSGIALVAVGCSLQQLDRQAGDFSACTSCPTSDGGGDVQATDVTPDQSTGGASGRSSLCGLTGCDPDPGGAPCSIANDGLSHVLDDPLGGNGDVPPATCRIILDDAGVPQASCAVAGLGEDGDACKNSTDCAGGFVCVEQKEIAGGACRSFCCYGVSSCDPGNYCSIRAVYDELSSTEKKQFVPVCAVADNCQLLSEGQCEEGEACVLVATGTTTCQLPGTGTENKDCPCAAGFVCAQELNKCLKLCQTGQDGGCPSDERCTTGNSAFPSGVGVCSTP